MGRVQRVVVQGEGVPAERRLDASSLIVPHLTGEKAVIKQSGQFSLSGVSRSYSVEYLSL